MPALVIQTNVPLDAEAAEACTSAASHAVASTLNKPEAYVMVVLHQNRATRFGGSTEPAALLTLRSLGLPTDHQNVTQTLTKAMAEQMQIDPQRIFCVLEDIPRTHWAMGGKTFA